MEDSETNISEPDSNIQTADLNTAPFWLISRSFQYCFKFGDQIIRILDLIWDF